MLTELFGLLSMVDTANKELGTKFTVNLNKNRLRSISAYSSNAIFYFPVITSDQVSFNEMSMVARMLERSYASFVVACISLMPFHRVKADDQASIEAYLSQFHQNIGMKTPNNAALGAFIGAIDNVTESAGLAELQDFLMESWEKSKVTDTDFIKIIAETVSINDMYNIDAVDPKTKVLQEQYFAIMDELNTWGFLGEATVGLFDDFENIDPELLMNGTDDDYDPDIDEHEYDDIIVDDELNEGTVKSAIDSIKFSMESVSANKIMSCNSLTKLATLESKLNKLKNKYAKYLNRYKKKYKENKEKGSKSKLSIRFNNMVISNPKAFMKQYGEYIKLINQRLKLVEKRRAELRKRKGLPADGGDSKSKKLEENVLTDITEMDYKAIEHCEHIIDEAYTLLNEDTYKNNKFDTQLKGETLSDDEVKKLSSDDLALYVDYVTHRYDVKSKYATNLEHRVVGSNREARKKTQQNLEADKKLRDMQTRLDKMAVDHRKELDVVRGVYVDKERGRAKFGDVGRADFVYDRRRNQSNINFAAAAANGQTNFKTFDRQIFTDMDMKKCNDAVPTFAKASIGFIVDETEEVVTRDVLVGIKTYIHRAASLELINDIYNCIINKRKFLKFVKFVSGEEKSLADLIFGFKELKADALDAKKGAGQWRSAFKRRKRWSKMSVPYLMKEYTPNGTIVMTMNEVEFIKSEYGIDIMDPSHIDMIMDADFLLGFVIIDQASEVIYVTYDGHGAILQQYTYSMLERETQTTDRMMRELYRSMNR